MAYLATNVFPGDGTKTFWDFSFAGVNPDAESGTAPYLYAEDVKALELYKDIEGNAASAVRIVTIDPAMPTRAHIDGAPVAAGRQIKIFRQTEIRYPLVDYRDRQAVSEADLDLANRQAIFVAQETQDVAQTAITLDKNDNYDVLGHRIVNLAPGVDDTDAINLSQLKTAIRIPEAGPVPALPVVADRANKLLSFDYLGNPVASLPQPGSATDLEIRLNAPSGAEIVGHDGTTVASALDELATVDAAANSNFDPVHLSYVDGSPLSVASATALITRGLLFYRVRMPQTLPVNLTGVWANDEDKLVEVLAESLRRRLADTGGAGLLGFNSADIYAAATVGFELKRINAALLLAISDLSDAITESHNLAEGTRGGNLGTTVAVAIRNLGEVGRVGVYGTPAAFSTRLGALWFRKAGAGSAFLISQLDRYKPRGAFVTPDNYAVASPAIKAYFVKPGGDDLAAGTSWATALSSIAVASQKTDVDVIFVWAGNYFSTKNLGTYTGTRSISIQGYGGQVNLISGPVANTAPTWNTTGLAGVYKQGNTDAALSGIVALSYQDSAGNPLTLYPAADVNGVFTRAGSWFRSATELFISLPNFDVPTSNIYYYQSAPMRVTGINKTVHLSRLNFIGGNAGAFSCRNGNVGTVIFGEDVGCCGQATGDGWQMKNMGLSIAIRVRCSDNGNDGFNYHGPDGSGGTPVDPHFIEIDCLGTGSRTFGTGNGSTSHEGARGWRINSHYWGNAGPGIADVNDAHTYNVGVTSRGNQTYGTIVSSEAAVAGGAKMYLDGCVIDGNALEDIVVGTGAELFHRDLWSGRDRILSSGTVTPIT